MIAAGAIDLEASFRRAATGQRWMLAKYGFECPEPTDGTPNFLLQTSGISLGEITLPSQPILQMHKMHLCKNMH